MYKKILIIVVLLLTSCDWLSNNENRVNSFSEKRIKEENLRTINELERLANKIGYKFVNGDIFPLQNPYNSYGTTCIFGVRQGNKNNSESVLFLAKKNKNSNQLKNYRDLIRYEYKDGKNIYDGLYEYVLIYATKTGNKYKIRDILLGFGLKGMYKDSWRENTIPLNKFYNKEDISDNFSYKVKNYERLIFIYISSDSANQTLFYYKNKWFEYIERDI